MARYGSDLIVDLMVEAGIEHVAFNPGASFRGIQDSLVHTDGAPELALCLHEAVAVGVAQGYAKAAGKPMGVLLHDVVGLQNAAMAIYNAWCDRTPMLLIGGTGPRSKATRRPWIDWIHTANVQGELVRDFVKWDDEPHDVASIPESFARGWTAATAAPGGPVYLCYDVDLQEDPLPADYEPEGIARYVAPSAPAAPPAELDELASLLRHAERPAIVAGHSGGDDASFAALGQLAELLGAPVLDTGARLALATDHPLNASGGADPLHDADVVLAVDVDDLRGLLGGRLGDGSREGDLMLLDVGLGHLRLRGWSQDYQALAAAHPPRALAAGAALRGLLARLMHAPPAADTVAERRARVRERIAAARAERRAAA